MCQEWVRCLLDHSLHPKFYQHLITATYVVDFRSVIKRFASAERDIEIKASSRWKESLLRGIKCAACIRCAIWSHGLPMRGMEL